MDLFPRELVSAQVQKSLPHGFEIRPLRTDDYEKGFLECLSHLTVVGHMSKNDFLERFFFMQQRGDHYFVAVIEDLAKGKIAAAGTVALEYKFIHFNGSIGHIEDIVVSKDYRGKSFGKWIIEQLKFIGIAKGCYKIILDCSQKNVPFYEKCGFAVKELQMVHYVAQNDRAKSKL